MAKRSRKRTPEEIRTIPSKATGRTGDRPQRRTPKTTRKRGETGRQNKRSTLNRPARAQATAHTARPEHRVTSTRKKSVMLTFDAPSGLQVSVTGNFNDWTPQAMTKGTDGLWRITVQLARGTYEYRFLVDGVWREDPNNPRKTQNQLGGYNSICDVL